MTIGLSICSMVVFAVGAKGSADPKTTRSQEVKEDRVGGGGGRVSDKHVSSERPKQASAKLVTGAKTALRAMGVNRHVMAAPERLPKNGMYLWCDPDGLWTLFWKGRQGLTVNATVTVGKPITVKAAVKATTSKVRGNQLKITNTSKARAGIVQFASDSDSVQLNILINGKVDPSRVYVGSQLSNPKQFPLKLATRRTFAQEGMLETKTTTSQQPKESVSAVYHSKTLARAAPPRENKGGGGSQGGAQKETKK